MSSSSRSSNLLLPFELLVNRCIAQDRKLAAGVENLAGKTLLLQITAPQLSVFAHFYPGSVVLTLGWGSRPQPGSGHQSGTERSSEGPAAGAETADPGYDGKISGTALALLSLLSSRQQSRPLVNPAIHIGGDSEFVHSVYRLFSQMEVDWQEPLSQVIGDVPTHTLQQMLNGLKSFSRHSADRLKRNIDEYLHEESQLVPPLNQVEIFDQDLDALRLRLDRLQARITLLTAGLASRDDQQPGSA